MELATFRVVGVVHIQVIRDIAGAAIGATGDGAGIGGDIDGNAMRFFSAGGNGKFAAAYLGVGVIVGLHDALGVFIGVIAGHIDPDARGVIAQHLLGDHRKLSIDGFFFPKILEAVVDQGDEHGGENQHQRLIGPTTRVRLCSIAGAVACGGARFSGGSHGPTLTEEYHFPCID